jgi:hypothetical protein
MKKALLFLLSVLFLSCSNHERAVSYSEHVSKTVYAVNDSIKAGRIEMAENYSDQTVRLITPPKDRIFIGAVVKKSKDNTSQRVIIVPESFKGKQVIVVNSEEYNELIKSIDVKAQFEKELEDLKTAKERVDEELRLEKIRVENLEKNLHEAEKTIGEQSGAIWKRNFIIMGLGVLIAGYFYIKVKGLIPLPF